jgi:uroporphyrinogen-III synthase
LFSGGKIEQNFDFQFLPDHFPVPDPTFQYLGPSAMHTFITRDLQPASEFLRRLSSGGWVVTGRSLVQFAPLPFASVPEADWIFFSSQQGVKFFFQQVDSSQLALPSYRWAALGKATGLALAEHIPVVDFTGDGDPVSTTAAFEQQAAGQIVLFPGARHSQRTVQDGIGKYANIRILEVYDNLPVSDPPATEADVLVFTSPLNVEAYCSKHSIRPFQRVVGIGATTERALRIFGVTEIQVPEAAGEGALASLVIRMAG